MKSRTWVYSNSAAEVYGFKYIRPIKSVYRPQEQAFKIILNYSNACASEISVDYLA